LQLVQIPLRAVVSDDTLWHHSFLNVTAHEKSFERAVNRLKQHLSMTCFWNKKHGLLTFVANFLVPQQNPMGRFAPRYAKLGFTWTSNLWVEALDGEFSD
jgi:hypothetical protein